jgi:monothiol bacilliredoxin
MRERIFELTTVEEVNEFLEHFPTAAIFKAGGCHKTMEGFGHVETAMGPRGELHMGFIRVIENRPASNHVAELTGIVHQSPQFILFVEGQAVYDVDNWDINHQVVEEALEKHLGLA